MTGAAQAVFRFTKGHLVLATAPALALALALALSPSEPPARAAVVGDNRIYASGYYPGVGDSAQAQLVLLAPGQASPLLAIPLVSTGGALSGQILGEAQPAPVPLDGVLVEARSRGRRVQTRSGSDGRFVLAGVPAGRVGIRFATDNPLSRERRYLALYYPGVQDPADATEFDLPDGETVALDPVVLPRSAWLSGLVLAAEDGRPLAGTPVRVERLAGSGLAAGADSGWTTRTSAQGRYVQGGLPPGTYRVLADTRGTGYVPEYYGGSRQQEGATPIQAAAGEQRDGLDIRPERGGVLSGTLRLDGSGGGLSGGRIEATHLSTLELYAGVSDESGSYRILGLPGGSYRVYAPAFHKYFINTPRIEEARPVRVDEGQEVLHVDFTGSLLTGCQVPTEAQGTIVGTITADFEGVSRAVVRAFSAQDTVETEVTGSGGYALGCLNAGLYKVAFLADGPLRAQYHPKVHRLEDAVEVLVAARDTVEKVAFQPQAGVRIEGIVTDAGSGVPLSGVPVLAVEMGSRQWTRTVSGADGTFSMSRLGRDGDTGLRTGLPAGTWRVQAESTLVPDPVLTPVLQPRLTATPGGAGEVRLEWRLEPVVRWSYRIERWTSFGLEGGGGSPGPEDPGKPGSPVVDGFTAPGDPEAEYRFTDRPEGPGTYRYRLTAAVQAGGAPGPGIFTAWSGDVRCGFTEGSEVCVWPPAVRIAPRPWRGTGAVCFRIPPESALWWATTQTESGGGYDDGLLRVYSAGGQEVSRMVWPRGAAEIRWTGTGASGTPVSSGVYFYLLKVSAPHPRTSGPAEARGTLLVLR